MLQPGRGLITRDQYDAVLLDLDGVTANLHAAWRKTMFDEYRRKRASERRIVPFDLATDDRPPDPMNTRLTSRTSEQNVSETMFHPECPVPPETMRALGNGYLGLRAADQVVAPDCEQQTCQTS
jgi:hypothetical protein